MLVLTETQIHEPLSANHLNCPGYVLHQMFHFKAGVCVYVKSSLQASRVSVFDIDADDFQILWLRFNLNGRQLFLASIYRSPNRQADDAFFEHLTSSVESIVSDFPSAEVVLLGDFNVHNPNWLISNRCDAAGVELEAFSILNDMQQLIHAPTRVPDRQGDFASTLDLFLTTHPQNYVDVKVEAPLGKSDHSLIEVSSNHFDAVTEKPQRRRLW